MPEHPGAPVPAEMSRIHVPIAWVTISCLILVGFVQAFGSYRPSVDAVMGWICVALVLSTVVFSVGLHKVARIRARRRHSRDQALKQEGILGSDIQAWWISVIAPLEGGLAAGKWNPNAITLMSFCFSIAGCLCFSFGWLYLGGWVILSAGTLDILDGRIARRTASVSRRGAFFDSCLDRYGEVLIFLGLASHYRESILFYVILLGLVGGLMVSYTRARAEGVGVFCKFGIMQRQERVVFLGLGSVFSWTLHMLRQPLGGDLSPYLMAAVLIFIAVLSNYTALSRIVHVMRVLHEEEVRENRT